MWKSDQNSGSEKCLFSYCDPNEFNSLRLSDLPCLDFFLQFEQERIVPALPIYFTGCRQKTVP